MKQIPFAKNYYVTETGDIYSSFSGNLKKMSPVMMSYGYWRIKIKIDSGESKSFLVHRLMALTFLGQPACPKMEVNHINGIKTDNRLSNLEWVTRSRNMKHAFELGLNCSKGENNGRHVLSETQVLEIYNRLLDGERNKKLADEYGVERTTIHGIKNRTSWTELTKDLPPINIKRRRESLGGSTVHWVCEQLQKGLSVKEILSISNNRILNEDHVRDIRRRKNFKYISCNYKWDW